MSTPNTTSAEQVVIGTEPIGAAPSGRRAGGAVRAALWLVKRLIGGIFVLWATATVIFILQALTETNRAKSVIQQLSGSSQNPSKADVSAFNHQFGLSESVIHQYFSWISGLAHGNLGISYFQHDAVTTIIGREIGATMVLTFTSLALAWIIAVTVTVLAAGRNNFFSRLGTGFQLVAAVLLGRDDFPPRLRPRPRLVPGGGGDRRQGPRVTGHHTGAARLGLHGSGDPG